ncbi:MAG: hypothetical protein ACFFD1_02940 [Candidatus Thorarchaeota archaeon]
MDQESGIETYYRGLIYAVVSDYGPKILYNFSHFDDDQTFPLSVQVFTLLGMGTGSRTAGTWMEYPYGPLPVPTGRPISSIIYSFLVEGFDSIDDRVKHSGRAAALIVLVAKQFDKYDQLRKYLNFHLPNWIKQHPDLKEKEFKQLNNEIGGKSFFKSNISSTSTEINTTSSEVNVSENNQNIKKENLMEKLLEMDNLPHALLILYSTSNNPTITELVKISGSSRIMTTFSLRKYVKQGIIELDGDNIRFLI